MDYYEYHIKKAADSIMAELKDRAVYDSIVGKIKDDIFSKSHKYKELWFLYDAPFTRGREWILKALATLKYHNITPDPEESVVDFLLKGKLQMKKDRENGLKLW